MRVLGTDGENLWISLTHTFVPPFVSIGYHPLAPSQEVFFNDSTFPGPPIPPNLLALFAPGPIAAYSVEVQGDARRTLVAPGPSSTYTVEVRGDTHVTLVAEPTPSTFSNDVPPEG
jgi:hypothetical protein